MPSPRTQPRTSTRGRPAGRPAGRRPSGRSVTVPRASARARKPQPRFGGVPGRRRQPPPSLAARLGQNAVSALKTVPAAGAARKAGQNKSKVALLAGLGAGAAALLQRRRSGQADEPEAPPTTTVVNDPGASVPVAPRAA